MHRLAAFALVLSVLALSACEDDVDPTLGIDAPFSLYGYLDPTADLQAIRVAPITDSIEDDASTVDATVESIDLETGQSLTWRDSVITYSDGTEGAVYVANFAPRPGSTVRLTATRSDGANAMVEVAIPAIVQGEVSEAVASPGEVTYPIQFAGVPRVLTGQLRLAVTGLPGLEQGVPGILVVPFSTEPRDVGGGVWTVEVPFLTATRRALEDQGLLNAGLRLIAADYVGFVANDAWLVPIDDPDALVEPGTFSNVAGGFGFVGAGYFSTARWIPSLAAQAAAGFVVDSDPASAVSINEIKDGDEGWVEFYNPLFDSVNLSGYSISDDQGDARKQTFPFGVVVPARGYLIVDLQFPLKPSSDANDPQVELALYDRGSERVSRVVLKQIAVESNATFGRFPDGRTFVVPPALGGFDLYLGPLEPTPGRSNRLGLDVAVVNEVYTEGASGFVEALTVGFAPTNLQIMDRFDGYFDAVPANGSPYGVADEMAGLLDLVQGGGQVYLFGTYFDPRLQPPPPVGKPPMPVPMSPQTRVFDVRQYGGQTSGRSVGYLPDGPGGVWTDDLRPTRGAPNANARIGL